MALTTTERIQRIVGTVFLGINSMMELHLDMCIDWVSMQITYDNDVLLLGALQ